MSRARQSACSIYLIYLDICRTDRAPNGPSSKQLGAVFKIRVRIIIFVRRKSVPESGWPVMLVKVMEITWNFTAPLTWPFMHIRHAACQKREKNDMPEKGKERSSLLQTPCVCFAHNELCGDDATPPTDSVIHLFLWVGGVWLVRSLRLRG